MKNFLVLLLLLITSLNATAASYYQVEIIVFEHLFSNADGEISQVGLKLPDFNNTVDFSASAGDGAGGFRLLSPGMYKLGGVYNELKFSRNYRPFLHMAWQQPQLGLSRAKNVRIRKTEGEASNASLIKLDGLVRIRSTQFLHADVDMFYFPSPLSESFIRYPVSDGGAGSMRTDFAELKETRKMKLNELHYFDHPLFGVLLRVSRLNVED